LLLFFSEYSGVAGGGGGRPCSRSASPNYREYFYSVDRVHGSALHCGRCAACCEAHANFADESARLTADNVWNEVVTLHSLELDVSVIFWVYVQVWGLCHLTSPH
jgi:hypothetical protein